MKKTAQDWQEEREYLANTVEAISKQIAQYKAEIAQSQDYANEIKQYYAQSSGIFGDIDPAEKVGIMSRIDDIAVSTNEQIDRVFDMEKQKARPYFGRVDFQIPDEKMQIYIGLRSINYDSKYYVIDWRAPVSELFYESGLGKSSYTAPAGIINGEVVLKRQYDIQNSELKDFYNINLNIFDEYLQKVLAQINTEQLHNIASTIQQEQNTIIRDLANDIVIVQGYAGSGKTTVALHRIAYALYRLKDLSSAEVLVFSLNEAFVSHIRGILPELGEQNTRSATFAKFVRRLLKLPQQIEENDQFMTRYFTLTELEQNEIKEKMQFSVKEKIKNWFNSYISTRKCEKGFEVREQKFTSEELNNLFHQDYGNAKLFDRVNQMSFSIASKLQNSVDEKLISAVREQILTRFDIEWDLLSLYKLFAKEQGWNVDSANEVIKYEDAILLCLFKDTTQSIEYKMNLKHIVIDEAQEYPLLFIDFLFRTLPHTQFSIFGDKYQRTTPIGLEDLKLIESIGAVYHTKKYYSLDNTYRSSEEIVEYCGKIINNPKHNIFRLKNGSEVVEKVLADSLPQMAMQIFDILEKLVAENNGTIGIITGDIEQAKGIYQELQKICPHRVGLVENAQSLALSQIQVLPVTLCKGLEFNSVIVIKQGGMFQSGISNNMFYIACTRAINKLIVFKKP